MGGPDLGSIFLAKIEGVGLEGLKSYGGVPIIFKTDCVKVVSALVDAKVPAPVICYPFEGDATTGIDLANFIGTAAQRRLQVMRSLPRSFAPMDWNIVFLIVPGTGERFSGF